MPETRTRLLALAPLGLAAVAPNGIRAQAPPAAPPPAAPTPQAAQRTCNPAEEICVTAQDLERVSAEVTRWSGFVDLRFGDSRIQAEQLELVQTKNPDGSVSQRIAAVGN